MTSRFFHLAHEMLVIGTPDGELRQLNLAWTRTLGWECGELAGSSFVDLIHPEDVELALEGLGRLGAGSSLEEKLVARLRARDGSYRSIDWRAVLDPGSKLVYAAGRDITDELASRAGIASREALLAKLVAEHEQARDAEQVRIAGELHDTAVQHCVAALMSIDIEPGAPAAELLCDARSQIRQAVESIRRVMSGLDVFAPRASDLSQQLRAIAEEMSDRFRVPVSTNLEAPDEIDRHVAAVVCRVAREGLVNAAKHSDRGWARLSIAAVADELVLTVFDSGGGCAEGGVRHRAVASRSEGPGTWRYGRPGRRCERRSARRSDATHPAEGRGGREARREPCLLTWPCRAEVRGSPRPSTRRWSDRCRGAWWTRDSRGRSRRPCCRPRQRSTSAS